MKTSDFDKLVDEIAPMRTASGEYIFEPYDETIQAMPTTEKRKRIWSLYDTKTGEVRIVKGYLAKNHIGYIVATKESLLGIDDVFYRRKEDSFGRGNKSEGRGKAKKIKRSL